MTEKVLRIKYAAELTILDLDPTYTFRYIKKYKYAGAVIEKVVELKSPYKVVHTYGKGVTTDIRIHHRKNGYAYSENLPINTEVAIVGEE